MEIIGALGMLLFQAIFMVAIVGGVLMIAQHQLKQQQSRWVGVAARHDLQLTPGGFMSSPSMRGSVDGVPVGVTVVSRKHGKSSTPYTVVKAATPVSMPHGLRVTREGYGDALVKLFGGQDIQLGDSHLDPDLRVRGVDEDAVRQVLSDPGVRALLPELLAASAHSRIEQGTVVLEERGRSDGRLDHHLAAAAALAKALSAAVQSPWEQLAQRTGLSVQGSGGSVDIEGQIDGLQVRARVQVGRSDEGPQTVVRVTLPDRVPALGVSLADRGSPDQGLRLGDPVLDGLIRVDAEDPAQARALLTGPAALEQDLHGKLLAVVHGHPGSVISGRELRVVGTGATADHAGRLIDEAIALAWALRAAARAVQAAPARDGDAEAVERARRALAAKQVR